MTIPWILITIIFLLVLLLIIFLTNRKKLKREMTKLTWIGFIFIIAGICFSDNRAIGYSLMSIGIILAVVDIALKEKRKRK